MMNLGDGLLFQLENGRPRLVLAKQGTESKSSNKKCSSRIPPKKQTQKSISSKQRPPQPDKAVQETKSKTTPAVSSVGQNITRGPRVSGAKPSVPSESAGTPQRESVVCLTQEQFQQILSTINGSSAANTHTHTEPVVRSEENCPGATEAAEELNGRHHKLRVSQAKTDGEPLSDGLHSGMFSSFGERERERDKLEARKAQWKRELDEQMALKKQQQASLRDERAHDESSKVRLKDLRDTDGMSGRTAAPAATRRDLPAAIRSAFIVGEAAPVEDMFHAHREEQQRRWLQELDRQREEDKLRRQQDKEMNSQVEDMELWAVHFDSLHQPSAVPDTGGPASHHRSGSRAPSSSGEAVRGGGLGTASMDSTQGTQQRSSHLRTMTALLDPAQIEERERRRLKQLEHQRAIEAQVEERRRQKEREEATRRAQEQEEERRVEREQERLQQQYISDAERQRHREEVKSRKTEELYQNIQRAQEEALKDRHVQRIRDLAKKGHDVSKLLHSLDGDAVSQVLSGADLPETAKSQTQRTDLSFTTSPRKDTAVQTEISHQRENESVREEEEHTALSGSSHGDGKSREKSGGHLRGAPKDPYETYARTGRSRRPEKRPEWNTQRPSKAFVPASERYPEALKRHRQESRRQRQVELMTLVERNRVSRTPEPNGHGPSPQTQSENRLQEPSAVSAERTASPPVPAGKSRVNPPSQQSSRQPTEESSRPLSDYVPYVRTDEVYQLDPLAPLSRPPTHDAAVSGAPLVRDACKSTERQQAILKGLSELRQGLLQRQRELETSLNPALQTQHRNYSSPFRPV